MIAIIYVNCNMVYIIFPLLYVQKGDSLALSTKPISPEELDELLSRVGRKETAKEYFKRCFDSTLAAVGKEEPYDEPSNFGAQLCDILFDCE